MMEPSAATADPRGTPDPERESRRRLHGLFLSPARTYVAFQPILELRDGLPIGMEALARFSGQVPVDAWIEGAQAAGVGTELEVLLARQAMARLADLEPGLFMSVNVSPQTFVSAAFTSCIREHDIHRVVFEITEHTPFPEAKILARQMACVREFGARIALDDVGSGFTSIRHVLALAPEFIKLDRTMVALAEHEPRHRAMIRALCSFGDETGSTIVAEGVETPQQLEIMREIGVRLGQGYLWARPGPLPGLRKLARLA